MLLSGRAVHSAWAAPCARPPPITTCSVLCVPSSSPRCAAAAAAAARRATCRSPAAAQPSRDRRRLPPARVASEDTSDLDYDLDGTRSSAFGVPDEGDLDMRAAPTSRAFGAAKSLAAQQSELFDPSADYDADSLEPGANTDADDGTAASGGWGIGDAEEKGSAASMRRMARMLAEDDEEVENFGLPADLWPTNEEERQYLIAQANFERKYERFWRQKDLEERAWDSHHHQKETTANMFAVVRRFAAVLTQVEEEDHATGFREVHIPSWARAELRFAPEYPQFETYLRGHLDDHLRKPPKEEQDDSELDLMDDVVIMTDLADGDKTTEAQVAAVEADDALAGLLGSLPGADLQSAAFAADIFPGDESPDEFEEELLMR